VAQQTTLAADFAVVDILFGEWLEDSDEVEALEAVEGDSVGDRKRVGTSALRPSPRLAPSP
jgi:hypothetical protein